MRVGDHVVVAVGYALANSVLVEGPEGVVVIDTTESIEAAREVMEAFGTVTNKPVVGVVYTHFHSDHINGAQEVVKYRRS